MTTRSDIDKINSPSGLNVTDKFMMTPEGGFALLLRNRTGAVSVKGTIVRASDVYDLGVSGTPISGGGGSLEPVGVIYNNGVTDNDYVWVVLSGVAEVLLKNGTAATRGNWVKTANVIGRADATNVNPPFGSVSNLDEHMKEIGHCLESKSAGVDVLVKVLLHFN